ncbi:UPF0149 family protein [Pseudomonas monteilii]|jgi:uncharacterized protein|uniref:Metal-binding protein n=2 Tax=Pseudomonas putida group TaxID=136845 RepID=A0AAP7FRQ0_9PSED|nr:MULTISPECIES: UPF0149 family protein [Pseudomonas]AYN17564.1 metal-binding protein [Pseudomonas monteilii]AYN98726.1 YecA family protein [Pseudomonas sp. LTGT-11-2Z]KPM66920.1 metal-binding protein [Pseudomonas putida]MBA1316961.1 UPF0149 family protein [Pseudomonas monteilii]MBA6102518.1 UPF0149 family protein [Pseudomonas monteilii]
MLPALSEKELARLEDLLITYGNDYSVLNLAELNGFFTALASSPVTVYPEQWLPAVAGGKVPKFKKPAHEEAYTALMLRYANQVAEELGDDVDHFEPLFEENEGEQGNVIVMEEWCFGYMRGTQVAGWEALPPEQDQLLKAISLHGLEDNFELLDQMSEADIQACVPQVVEAARGLYRYFNKLH